MRADGISVTPALSHEEKYRILTSCWTPGEDYVFPKISNAGQVRSFRLQYLKKWSWLAYSEVQGGGAVCRFCVIFARSESSGPGRNRTLGALVAIPFNKFKHAGREFENHQDTQYHKDAVLDGKNFTEWYERKDQ